MFIIDHDIPSGTMASWAVAQKRIKPHFGLFAGCGCMYFPKGTWLDSTPKTPVVSGQEADKICLRHLRDFYNGIPVNFP